MSELPQVNEVPLPGAAEPTAGMLLRAARTAAGLQLAALAVAMKVSVKKLEALEADQLGELHDGVFVRALAGSVCRALKMDPAPVLSKLPRSVAPKLDRDERGINMPFRSRGMQRYGSSIQSVMSRPAAMWVLGLLLAALAVLYFPEVRTGADKVAGLPAASILGGAVASGLVALQPPVPAVMPAEPASPAPLASASALPVPVPPTQAAPERVAREAAVAQVSDPAGDLLVFKAKATAWVRVSDAKGAIQFEKTLAAGEVAAASGTLPLAIVVGNVGATELLVRGQPFNLEEVAKSNVARFEVK